MRLCRLWLGNYFSLKNVEIKFDSTRSLYGSTSIRFFVGRNGSGKSSALRAIGYIFSHLAANAPPDIAFELEYELGGRQIKFTNQLQNYPDQSHPDLIHIPTLKAAIYTRDDDQQQWIAFSGWNESGGGLLPTYVVGYATGPSNSLQDAMTDSLSRYVATQEQAFEREPQPEGMTAAQWATEREARREDLRDQRRRYLDNTRTIFFDPEASIYAALALLAHDGDGSGSEAEVEAYRRRRAKVLRQLGLNELDALAAFNLHISRKYYDQLEGVQRATLDRLLDLATTRAPLYTLPSGSRDFYAIFHLSDKFRRNQLPNLGNEPDAAQPTQALTTPVAFFQQLLAWRRQRVIQNVQLILDKTDVPGLLLEKDLSDGEYLYLGRYALLLMMRDEPNCLFLLDEPDTYFNDRWKVELVNDINDILSNDPVSNTGSEVIIATHASLTLTDADRRQVYIFKRDPASQQIAVEQPGISLLAGDVGEISQVLFGLDRPVGRYAKSLIAAALADESDLAQRRIEVLLNYVGPGFSRLRLRDRLLELTNGQEDGNADPA